jgi:hypothetical protein
MRAMSDLPGDRRFSPRDVTLRALPIVGFGVIALVILFLATSPLPQPLSYHDFKDDRTLLGVPNALNVLSNVPFLLVGAWGLWFLLVGKGSRPGQAWQEPAERWAFVLMFLGVALTGFGSAYYHLRPDNDRLVWDRLPMALGFMGLIVAMLAERISVRLANWLLLPLAVIGVGSVLQWHWTEQLGRGDLRLYGFVQYYSLFFVLVTPLLFPPRYTRTADWYVGLGWYLLAKVCEALDGPIYSGTAGIVSGHTLKHLLGAVGTYWLLRMLMLRRPLSLSSPLAPEAGARGE